MYNILIPTDFSENAKHAVNYAVWLFQGNEVNFFLFNAYGTNRSEGSMLISIDDILKKEAEAGMKEEINRAKSLISKNMKINGFTRNCTLTSYIEEVIDDWNIDLVILGTKGETGIKGKLIGSNATNVIRKIDIPIIAIPYSTELDDLGEFNIAFGSDLKPFKGRDQIAKLIAELDSEVRKVKFEIFYITSEKGAVDPEARKYMNELCNVGECTYVNVVDKDIEKGLDQYIDKKQPDLLMLVHRRDSFLSRILGNSISQSMMLKAEMPILVLHDS